MTSLTGSTRRPLPGVETLGPVTPDERVEATIVLRRRASLPAGLHLTRDEPAALSVQTT